MSLILKALETKIPSSESKSHVRAAIGVLPVVHAHQLPGVVLSGGGRPVDEGLADHSNPLHRDILHTDAFS